MKQSVWLAFCLAPAGLLAQASPPEEELRILDFMQVLDTKVRIASRLLQSQEEAPSVVSVITREDIERFGWRDLLDILRTVPGFDFANDGTNLIGLSVRGVWAHEGKALLLVDGVPMSPFHNGNVNYYGQFPAQLIQRVEIIRGPGSAVYGQFAGCTVIEVTTRSIEDPDGGRFTARGISMGAGNHGGGAFLEATGRIGKEGRIALSVGYQSSPFSNRDYVDTNYTGKVIPMSGGDGQRQVTFLSADLDFLGNRIHLVRNEPLLNQSPNNGSGGSVPPPPGIPGGFFMSSGRAIQGFTYQRDLSLGSQWTLLPRVDMVQNTGGSINPNAPASSGVNNSGTSRERFTGELGLRWHPKFPAVLLLGGGVIRDFERSINVQNQGGMVDPADGSRLAQVIWHTRYGYGQYTQQIDEWGFTVGGRYEDNRLSHAFAPRLGLTFATGPFNAKLLYGEAFRIPTIFQTYSTFFDFRGFLKPELIRTMELELGWKFQPNLRARLNLYQLSVTRTLSFGLDPNGFYIQNFGNYRTRGVEGGLEWREATHGGFFNVSISKPTSDSDPFFLSPDRSKPLAVSALKANLGAYVHLGPVELSPSLQYGGSRETQSRASAQGPLAPTGLMPALVETDLVPAKLTWNLAASWRNLRPGMDLRCSIQNLTNADTPLLQPYYGGHAPLPAFDRRFTLDLTWHF
jgi:outer membrane cobalamin receptor